MALGDRGFSAAVAGGACIGSWERGRDGSGSNDAWREIGDGSGAEDALSGEWDRAYTGEKMY